LTNNATRAVVSVTFTAASDPVNFRGPLSGGKKGKGGKKGRKYKVQKGDTLRKLANKFYGSPSKWKIVAKANGIKSATAKLKPGRVLTIPANSKTKKGKKPKAKTKKGK
ncbi:MAG: LysM peptidoglycan-binding domain-containing protein, partial [Burkholderiaceae bacterium]